MAQPVTHMSEIIIINDEGGSPAALHEFLVAAHEDPAVMQDAISDLSEQSYNVPTEAQQAARHILTDLLDATWDGFNIDYDTPFIRDVLHQDANYNSHRVELAKLERQERGPQMRVMALRGLWLYIQETGYTAK
jgi:hypothetical protein